MPPHLTQTSLGSPIQAGSISTTTAQQNSSIVTGPNNSPPCSTLFIANLGQFVNEQELKDLFSVFPGFCRLKMYNRGGSPVAFAEYSVSI